MRIAASQAPKAASLGRTIALFALLFPDASLPPPPPTRFFIDHEAHTIRAVGN